MDTANQIELLKRIKKAIYTSDAVTCVVWMPDSNETVVEAIDSQLIELGVPEDEVERDNESFTRGARE